MINYYDNSYRLLAPIFYMPFKKTMTSYCSEAKKISKLQENLSLNRGTTS